MLTRCTVPSGFRKDSNAGVCFPNLRICVAFSNTHECSYKFNSFLACVKHTYKTEHLNGFWRGKTSTFFPLRVDAKVRNTGVVAPLASITLVRTVSFSIYQKAKYTYDRWIFQATGRSPLVTANTRGAHPTFGTIACFAAAGATSGALITAISCPSFHELDSIRSNLVLTP